jgi:hypothetical protein
MKRLNILRLLFALTVMTAFVATARAADQNFNGRWDITVHAKPGDIHSTSAKAWWLGITGAGTPDMKVQFVGAPDGALDDMTDAKIQDGVLTFTWTRAPRPGVAATPNDHPDHVQYSVKYVNGALDGTMTAAKENLTFTGARAPEINEHDDNSWVKGKAITLFDGKTLNGWKGLKTANADGWTVEDGVLKSAGHADDLLTAENFWNFELHAEYAVGPGGNSGIGLRGRYEVQIMDDYGKPAGPHNTGSLYMRIIPPENYGKPAGEWQTLDIRLVGREVTGTLNGHKLYTKGVIDGLTGIAIDPNEGQPGPIELQGDHGAVQFRNIVLTPLTQSQSKLH